MLKAMLPLSTAFGLFAAVPMSADREPRTLSEALSDTIETLEVLRGYRSADPRTLDQGLVLEVTEPALGDSNARVERLESLGNDLERLHAHLELLQSGALPASAPIATEDRPAVPTVGLAEGELDRLIANSFRARTVDPSSIGADATGSSATNTTANTTSNTSAPALRRPPVTPVAPPNPSGSGTDPVDPAASDPTPAVEEDQAAEIAFAKARAAYFAGRYDTALTEFEAGPDDARHHYWRARTLEQLDRLDEALALYDLVVADPAAGDLAQKAEGDADFLRWKLDFEQGGTDADAQGGSGQ